ncbi:polysaccharide deacetylase family protein [Phenylobacterium sp.]|uniref:polysaccharide deacetylase family protein n=1 Tax=Phenylobacterium sp. TaxID=1871053 RepID=UPI002DF1758C|nr:polysaccharide deacetylase family protein [Phenylobacterium sp.]
MIGRFRPVFFLLAVVVVSVWWIVFQNPEASRVYIFKGVSGPVAASKLDAPAGARIEDFEHGSPNRLAVLVTDPSSGWLGLVRTFRAHGIPVTFTRNPAVALTHRVILVYPMISGRALSGDTLRALAAHVRSGGTVLGFELAGGGLEPLFGVEDGVESRARSAVAWSHRTGVPQEDLIAVSHSGEDDMGTIGYRATTARVLGTFDDGSAAVTCRTTVGQACLMGVDLGALAGRAMNGRAEGIGRTYVNGYEPSLDVLVDWVRDLYVANEPMPWLVSTVPAGKDTAILLSHDVDFTRSVVNSKTYGEALRRLNVDATFFVQTKYVRDYNDDIFFNDRTVPMLKALARSGMDVESHSVAHARTFKAMELGTGRERYPDYVPFVVDAKTTKDATILGELRVSKFLLESLLSTRVRTFRPGYLAYPFKLPQALAATGYGYSSSITANATLTHLPFQLTNGRADDALSPVFEFPVTIEDEEPPGIVKRQGAANGVIERVARGHGIVVVLVHPDVTAGKLAFETQLVRDWRDRAWVGSVTAFGDWWRARDLADVDLVRQDGRWVIEAGGGPEIKDLLVLTPKGPSPSLRITRSAGQRTATAIP